MIPSDLMKRVGEGAKEYIHNHEEAHKQLTKTKG